MLAGQLQGSCPEYLRRKIIYILLFILIWSNHSNPEAKKRNISLWIGRISLK
jgi:hypothetical protein